MSRLHAIEEALRTLAAGRPVLVVDDPERENEGDVVLAAQTVTDQWLAWTIRHTSGYLCAPMPATLADQLELPLMVPDNQDRLGTAYTVSVDAAAGTSTGISASDRTRTLRTLADPACTPTDLVRPGHVLPLRARAGGVLERRGHTEAAVDLCRLAGLAPVGAIAELVHDDGQMMRLTAMCELAARHDLPVISIADLVAYRERHDRVDAVVTTTLPTGHGRLSVTGFRDRVTGAEHLALTSPREVDGAPLVRVHSECLTGDALGSLRCDCGPQLEAALACIAREGGMVIYLRGHEGRGVGLLDKLRAYAVQDAGADTIDAQHRLGLPVDAREYGAAAAILHLVGADSIRLLTNNPEKVKALQRSGIRVQEVVPHHGPTTVENAAYVRTKQVRLGHTAPQGLSAVKGVSA